MAISVDVLNSTLQHLLPKFALLFLQSHPLLDEIIMGKRLKTVNGGGPYLEFTVLKGGPGQITGIRTGNELIQSTRRNNSERGNQYAYRAIYHWDVPRKELAMVNSEYDFAKLIENYPTAALNEFKEAYARQLARGSASAGSDPFSTALDGFLTLNGQQDYNPEGTPRDGVFQFSETQNNTVFGLPMKDAASGVTGWYHQYAHVDNFSIDGISTLRKLVTRANSQGLTENGGVNVMFADEGTFHNYIDTLDQKAVVNDKIAELSSKYSGRDGVPFGKAIIWWEPAIDCSDTAAFSGVAQDGVLYGLNTHYWELFQLGNNADMAGSGFFDMDKPIRTPNQDSWHYEIVSFFNPYCTSLRHQLAMTGGAIL